MSSIDTPPIREKFHLMSTVALSHQEMFTSFQRGIKHPSWKKFCATLFGLNSAQLKWIYDKEDGDFLVYVVRPNRSFITPSPTAWNRHFTETESFVPEPILSHRLANVAILCMQYLDRLDFNTLPSHYHFLASWETKSKQLPWLFRRRMRVISMRVMRRRRPNRNHGGHKYSFPQKLQRSRQITYSETIQSLQEQRLFYTWTLDLLYHTLRKAMKSDVLTRALSKPFIPLLAPILFPRSIKRVRKAARAYLENVSRRFLV